MPEVVAILLGDGVERSQRTAVGLKHRPAGQVRRLSCAVIFVERIDDASAGTADSNGDNAHTTVFSHDT